LNNKSKLIN